MDASCARSIGINRAQPLDVALRAHALNQNRINAAVALCMVRILL
jgi:hypothetical protein